MSPNDLATVRQIDAADPADSTWLSANAGSGKTRVLIDRVARLLLAGTAPQNILCLTYTKAAATEMQNRLFRRLGDWSMLEDADLAAQLRDLGITGPVGTARLQRARTLFARAIETPGGLRIQTIHSFCAGLLRRFPLEAGVSPQFREIEDQTARLLRADVVDAMAMGPDAQLVERLAGHVSAADFGKLTAEIFRHRDAFLPPRSAADLAALYGLHEGADRDEALAIAFDGTEPDLSRALTEVFATAGKSYLEFAAKIAALSLKDPNWPALESLFKSFLDSKTGDSRAARFPQANHTNVVAMFAPIAADIHAWMDRVAAAFDHLRNLDNLEKTTDLHAFARAFLPRYESEKGNLGLLDFDDLIARANLLLTDPGLAQWVLFRLDGGIDHILVDEAQDTSPAQWRVIERLTAEFAAGAGADPARKRTIFVVGDKKQSIYSFQGADPEAFARMAAHFGAGLARSGQALKTLTLEHSFRSSEAILRLVDLTFAGAAGDGLGDVSHHQTFKTEMPGRVDLWPLIPPDASERPDRPWHDPMDAEGNPAGPVALAALIARQIRHLIDTETIPVEIGQTGLYRRRRITEGDILILVQRRSALFGEIIRACKAAGLRVAGSDRLKVGAELAVRDLAALLRFLALPEDDLSLAEALRSPLLGWSEQDLFTLAHHRPARASLWQALRGARDRHPQTLAVLDDLLREADYLRPHDLVERILTRHRGRLRLLARLGAEAEDGIDAFLEQALAHERDAVPGLTAFLNWMQTEDLEKKRQTEAGADMLRVMSVHGAKGLESPIVILPDTTDRNSPPPSQLLAAEGAVIWNRDTANAGATTRRFKAQNKDRELRERKRLLYVAMTRAEKWLIVCGAGKAKDEGESWHGWVAQAMQASGALPLDTPTGPGKRYGSGDWTGLDLATPPPPAPPRQTAPRLPAVAMPASGVAAPLSPSDLGGAKVMPGDPAETDQAAALQRGTWMHLLLEHLPGLEPEARAAAGLAILQCADPAPAPAEAALLAEQAARLIADPALAAVFGPEALAEVAISASLPGWPGRRLHGSIDRLILSPGRLLAVDFKTNRLIPPEAAAIPEGLLRQMAAYAAMLAQVFPDHLVQTAILWTAGPRLMPIGPEILAPALERALALPASLDHPVTSS